jgi:hypothetical protein
MGNTDFYLKITQIELARRLYLCFMQIEMRFPMALISDLVSAIAEVEGLPEATVSLAARYAREAGYLSTGARGRNAPRATVTDCANLLIAVNGSGCIVKDAPKAVEMFRNLLCHAPHGSRTPRPGLGIEYGAIEHDQLRFIDRHGAATFGEILESVIDRCIGGEMEAFMMSEASKYLGEPYFEKARAELGDDAKALAERAVESCKGLINLDTVAITIEFYRPMPHARLVIDRSVGGDRELIAGASFIVNVHDLMAGNFKNIGGGDRRERTAIGYRTLMKIAEVMS